MALPFFVWHRGAVGARRDLMQVREGKVVEALVT
jgi:hypothetical protein